MTSLRAVLFDLDGTLVQARESTWRLFERTNREFSLGIDTQQEYFDLFRDNLFEALPRICGDKAEPAIAHFLDLMRNEYAPPIVPGMVDVVRSLATNCVLGIVSSNAVSVIRRVIEEAGLSACIAHVFGGDVVPDKRVAIRSFLADPSYATLRLGSNVYEEVAPIPLTPGAVAFVTDTVGDVRHGVDCGVRVIGVTWGLHDPQELKEAGADFIAQWPMEIVSWVHRPVLGDTDATPSTTARKRTASWRSADGG